jgi:hypothetical protein
MEDHFSAGSVQGVDLILFLGNRFDESKKFEEPQFVGVV